MARIVSSNCHVEIELISQTGESEHLSLDIVPDSGADFSAGFLGASTPLARAIIGKPAGAHAPYKVGDLKEVRILAVSEITQPADGSAKREAAMRDTMNQVAFTNAVNFAASTDTKWGEYDADGLDFDKWKPSPPEEKKE